MPNGTVARLIAEKGFGFIKGEDGIERFFHRSACIGFVYEQLREGQDVTYEDETGPKGPRAGNVRIR
jgi:CspA family cold shock protein